MFFNKLASCSIPISIYFYKLPYSRVGSQGDNSNKSICCVSSLFCSKKEGVEEQFPKVRENSVYEKLLNPLDKRELRGFGSTKGNNQ